MSVTLQVDRVSVAYGPVVAVRDVSLEVGAGEVLALLGPSGSGKTTLLHAVAGFNDVTDGAITIAGMVVSAPRRTAPPEQRRVGVVFQSYALWPHLTVVETVAYPFERRGIRKAEARAAALDLLERVGLGAFADRKPSALSGGQQQRVGLARALAVDPVVFLFDEPTANLDSALKATLQAEIRAQQQRTGAAALYVTHDPTEAFAVADRVAVLRDARLIQIATPAAIYRSPLNRWVAGLTGVASFFVADRVGPTGATVQGRTFPLRSGPSDRDRGPVTVCVRPEWVALDAPDRLALAGAVTARSFRGPHTDYTLATPVGSITARMVGDGPFAVGEAVSWQPHMLAALADDAATDAADSTPSRAPAETPQQTAPPALRRQ